jgi:hypothetical protein
VRNAEGLRGRLGEFPLRVGNGHQLASGIAGETWKVGRPGPGAGAKNADANAMFGGHVIAMIARRDKVARVSTNVFSLGAVIYEMITSSLLIRTATTLDRISR